MNINKWDRQAAPPPPALRLAFSLGLALLIAAGLLLGLKWSAPALALSNTLYVDGQSGADTPACGPQIDPCQSISYTLNTRAASGDSLLIAGGAYTENLTIHLSVTLQGGYDPSTWTRSGAWTVIDGSAHGLVPGEWDGEMVRYPHVLEDGAAYKMWYVGAALTGPSSVGYATSSDGITWTRYPDPVLEPGAAGEWDSDGFEAPFVIKENDTSYRMWYTGYGQPGPAIGYATSTDGIHWTKHPGNPILTAGSDGWNNEAVYHSFVLQASGAYTMYLTTNGNDGSGSAPHMAYATSSDGLAWTLGSAPLFDRTWEAWFWDPTVIQDGGQYRMWYSAWAGEGVMGYVTSTNGLDWTNAGGPVFTGTAGEWDEGAAIDPSVLPEGGGYTLWYDNNRHIGRATSANGLDWTKPSASPVYTGGTPTAFGLPVIQVDNPDADVVLDGRFTIQNGAGEEGGGVHAQEATVTIRDSLIWKNWANGAPYSWAGGGVIAGSGVLTLEDSWVLFNTVSQGAGGVRVGPGTLVMTNTLVAENVGDFGIHLNGSAALMNVTIAGNEMGLLFNSTAPHTLDLTNSVIYHNNGPALETPNTGSVQVTYSDIEGGYAGAGNIDADPFFTLAGDYHPLPGSPLIDAGSPTGGPDHDLDGNPRPFDGNLDGVSVVDMGAFESVLYWMNYLPLLLR